MLRTPASVDTIKGIDKNGANCTISFMQDDNFNAAAEQLSAQMLSELIRVRDSGILINVPEITKKNISKISDDFGQQSDKFNAIFFPILNGFKTLVSDEKEIIGLANTDPAKLRSIKNKFNNLETLHTKLVKINADLNPLLNLMDKRCIQLQEQIDKINKETLKEAHQKYSELLAGQKKFALKAREGYQFLVQLKNDEALLYPKAEIALAALEQKIKEQQAVSSASLATISGNIRLPADSSTTRKRDYSPSNSSDSSDQQKNNSNSEDSPVFAPRNNNTPTPSFLYRHNKVQPVEVELTAAQHQQALSPSQPDQEVEAAPVPCCTIM